jgi:hypothetical protein
MLAWLTWTDAVTLVMFPRTPLTSIGESPTPFEGSTCGVQSGIATGVLDENVFFVVVDAACVGTTNAVVAISSAATVAIPTR